VSYEEDPEVVADLQLRSYTERSRKGISTEAFGAAVRQAAMPPRIVDKVPCRGRCGSLVDWPEDAEDRFQLFNRILAAKAEAPLDKTRIVFCDKCRAQGMAMQGERNRKATDMMRQLIVELRAGAKPERERELLDKIKKLGHPDVEGLVQAIQARRETKGTRRNAL